MKEEEFLNTIETLNKSYLISEEYKTGTFVCYIKNLIKKKKYFQVFKLLFIRNKKNNNKISTNINNSSKPICINTNINKKIAVYTCITGNYDNIIMPLVYEKNCDYILFTNNKELKSDFWKIIYIDDNKLNNNTLLNRFIKMHPQKYLNDYDFSIYIDGNIQLVSTISEYVDKVNSKTGLAIHKHHYSTSLQDELKSCKKYSKGDYKKLYKQVNYYYSKGFPNNFGMYECNMIITDLHNPNAIKILDNWWNEFCSSSSNRDQFSLPFVIWSNKLNYDDVGIIYDNINENPKLKIISHK